MVINEFGLTSMKLSMWDAMVALVAAPHKARSSMSQAEVAARRLSCAEKRCLGATVGGDKPPSPSFAGPADEEVGSGHWMTAETRAGMGEDYKGF